MKKLITLLLLIMGCVSSAWAGAMDDMLGITELKKQLSDIFKTKVKISSGKNKGKIEFEFYNKDDFERLLFELKK